MKNITIVGLGGIGSILSNVISKFVSNKILNTNDEVTINLIDGDDYEMKNLERQEFSAYGNKAESKSRELKDKYSNIDFKEYPLFIDHDNINKIIKN